MEPPGSPQEIWRSCSLVCLRHLCQEGVHQEFYLVHQFSTTVSHLDPRRCFLITPVVVWLIPYSPISIMFAYLDSMAQPTTYTHPGCPAVLLPKQWWSAFVLVCWVISLYLQYYPKCNTFRESLTTGAGSIPLHEIENDLEDNQDR